MDILMGIISFFHVDYLGDLNQPPMMNGSKHTMKSILQQLYRGEINPDEQFMPMGRAYTHKHQQRVMAERDFLNSLEGRQRERFMEIINHTFSMGDAELEEAYIQGMRMGARLIVELMGEGFPVLDMQAMNQDE